MDNHPDGPEPFDAADTAFRLLCAGPQPLALHASKVAATCPLLKGVSTFGTLSPGFGSNF